MKQVYAVMREERHTEPEAFLFSTPEAAVAYAKEIADDYRNPNNPVDPEDAFMTSEDLAAALALLRVLPPRGRLRVGAATSYRWRHNGRGLRHEQAEANAGHR